MIIIKNNLTPLDATIINSIKDLNSMHVKFKNITFDCETIEDASGHVFVRKPKQDECKGCNSREY